ncbi:MAG: hypothetical protein SFV18_19905 [Bryobacteraceae bacterium]|nr:hypothetical protein [Bryobacteraceae bacterium]
MIVTKTPFRLSFFGGGTDYPEYFESHGGSVLTASLDHWAFVSISRFYSKLFDYNLRVGYRQLECVKSVEEIQHGGFRECLRRYGVTKDAEINYTAHLPAFTGVGSSSSFLVGLLNALHAYRGRTVPALDLAYEAIEMERHVLNENVGCQDQAQAAVGGFNVLEFRSETDIRVHPVGLSPERLAAFENHLLMFFTGIRRRASDLAGRQIDRIPLNLATLRRMREMVDEAHSSLLGGGSFARFGELLHESWRLKQTLDSRVSNPMIGDLYETGLRAGALGGKLLGAGGGGFLVFFVPPERHAALRQSLSRIEEVPVRLGVPGSHRLTGADSELPHAGSPSESVSNLRTIAAASSSPFAVK